MFKTLMVPVDLAHVERISRSLDVAADLSRHYKARIVYVSVTSAAPGSVAHNPEEFAEKLQAFAAGETEARGIETASHPVVSHDPTTDVDDALIAAVGETGADLVVMASHKPGLAEYFWPSNGGKLASHTGVSVMLIRDP